MSTQQERAGVGQGIVLDEAVVDAFATRLRGALIQRSDERYEEARKLYNGMIDKRPLLIARCSGCR